MKKTRANVFDFSGTQRKLKLHVFCLNFMPEHQFCTLWQRNSMTREVTQKWPKAHPTTPLPLQFKTTEYTACWNTSKRRWLLQSFVLNNFWTFLAFDVKFCPHKNMEIFSGNALIKFKKSEFWKVSGQAATRAIVRRAIIVRTFQTLEHKRAPQRFRDISRKNMTHRARLRWNPSPEVWKLRGDKRFYEATVHLL